MEQACRAGRGSPAAALAGDQRRVGLTDWARTVLRDLHPEAPRLEALEVVSSDASHRRYFRARPMAGVSCIAVDAPPEKEDSKPFVKVGKLLRDADLRVPEMLEVDLAHGYLLLEDFGDRLYLPCLLEARKTGDGATIERLYRAAIDTLLDLQEHVDALRLPHYDRTRLMEEMSLFPEWFCRRWLQVEPGPNELAMLDESFGFLCEAALGQTQVAVHRDYHSRNLMLLAAEPRRPGVIDFQDAVRGACSYDLVSLLRDCYVEWQPALLDRLIGHYLEGARARNIIGAIPRQRFRRDFDLMGLQRHLKVLGIFCRLAIRDQKPGFLADLPLVMRYFTEVAGQYRQMAPLLAWFRQQLEPRARQKLAMLGKRVSARRFGSKAPGQQQIE